MTKSKNIRNRDLAARIEARATNDWTDDDCWLCDRATTTDGYVQVGHMYKQRGQHIVAWEMHNAEPVPEGMVVMHICDNPGCFNPNHLTVGTHSDNTRDAVAKGRWVQAGIRWQQKHTG